MKKKSQRIKKQTLVGMLAVAVVLIIGIVILATSVDFGSIADMFRPAGQSSKSVEASAESSEEESRIDPDFTGLLEIDGQTVYIVKGEPQYDATGLMYVNGDYYLLEKGIFRKDYIGLTESAGELYYVSEGKVKLDHNGVVEYKGDFYSVKNGIVDQSCTGIVKDGDKGYLFENGKAIIEEAGLVAHEDQIYLFAGDGSLESGWYDDAGGRMYFDGDTFAACMNGVFPVDEETSYLFDKDGYLETDKWNERSGYFIVNKHRYHMEEDGKVTDAMLPCYEKAVRILDEIGWDDLYAAYQWTINAIYWHTDYELLYPYSVPEGESHINYFVDYGLTLRTLPGEAGADGTQGYVGNCYVFAAVFTSLARMMGYDAYFIEGVVPHPNGDRDPHGWCEIEEEDGCWIYDPEYENHRNQHTDYHKDCGWRTYNGSPDIWDFADGVRAE